jgi:CBS domain containing-hemolysin-like protein
LTIQVVLIFTLLFILFLFSGFEFAFENNIFIKLEPDKKNNSLRYIILPNLLKKPNNYFSIVYFGRLLAISALCFCIINYSHELFSIITYLVIIKIILYSLIVAILIYILGILLPRTIYKLWPKSTLDIASLPIAILYYTTYPIVWFILEITIILSRLFIAKNNSERKEFKANVKLYFNQLAEVQKAENEEMGLIEHDVKLFQNALEFSKVKVRDCTIPRNEVEAVELNSSIEKLKERFIETGFSKILIYHETIDNVIGYAQSIDIFKSPKNIQSILKSLVIIPETMPANKLLNQFLKDHKSIALVVDEYGGTFGITTLEDIMEEIFGDIEDEHDTSEFREEKISEIEYIFSGRLEIDYLNEKYNLQIPEMDEYATVAGYILHFNEEIPKENDKIKIENFEFEILKLQNPKIKLVKLKLLK